MTPIGQDTIVSGLASAGIVSHPYEETVYEPGRHCIKRDVDRIRTMIEKTCTLAVSQDMMKVKANQTAIHTIAEIRHRTEEIVAIEVEDSQEIRRSKQLRLACPLAMQDKVAVRHGSVLSLQTLLVRTLIS